MSEAEELTGIHERSTSEVPDLPVTESEFLTLQASSVKSNTYTVSLGMESRDDSKV